MYGASAHGLLFPAVPTAPIPPAGAQDPLQLQLRAKPRLEPIVPVEPSKAPYTGFANPGKAPKCAKKGGEKELNLDWELVAGGKRWWARDLAHRVQLSKSQRKIGVEDGYTVSTPRPESHTGCNETRKAGGWGQEGA
ncbi:hypothetical protein B0H14DRAFT_3154953 [Mycena olivaceomarginata]|nr:hypothetical protein B0H14DRAFT_3154953 [Mycena olivaceomarginata]